LNQVAAPITAGPTENEPSDARNDLWKDIEVPKLTVISLPDEELSPYTSDSLDNLRRSQNHSFSWNIICHDHSNYNRWI
jgi:hypothetical protein